MTFGDFARNYLNPIYLGFRAGLLYVGGAFLMIAVVADEHAFVTILSGLFGAWVCWTGIRPWGSGRGLSIAQLQDMARRARDR